MAQIDPDEQRARSREMWERAAAGWGTRAQRVREWGMPVSAAMIDALALAPGQTVLELAAGPGDTGFMAAEMVKPQGRLICSDGSEAMLQVARERAAEAGVDNVEFRQLELEWIDLETATIDAVLCRWGIMLVVDPEAAAQEIRRVLRSGGQVAVAVWDVPERNPWTTIPSQAMQALGHSEAPDPSGPGMFRLAANDRLQELLEGAGFVEVTVARVGVERRFATLKEYVQETFEMSPMLGTVFRELDDRQRAAVTERIGAAAEQFETSDGSLVLPGSSLVASAAA
ncbi:MAG: methyltransferase domain-containing protein [Solirubrobacteraceae bacterium]